MGSARCAHRVTTMPSRSTVYRFRVTRKSDGKAVAYTNVKAHSMHDAKEILLRRLHVPESKWDNGRCPFSLALKRGGDYKEC